MSHMTQIKSQIKSVEALRQACKALGATLEGEGHVRNVKCDYVIRSLHALEVGFVRQDNGTYNLVGDDMALTGAYNYVHPMLGKACQKLKQQYSLEVLRIEARRKGLRLTQSVQADGHVRVELTGRTL